MVDSSREAFEAALAKAMLQVCVHPHDTACDSAPVHSEAFAEVIWRAAQDAPKSKLPLHANEPESLWGWPIEELKAIVRMFQSDHPGKSPLEVEESRRALKGEG